MDKVKFYLPDSNFKKLPTTNGFRRDFMKDVLKQAFGTSCERMMEKHGCGFYIICRQEQFARFIIARAEGPGVNGIRCLDAKFVPHGWGDPLQKMSSDLAVTQSFCQKFLDYLNISECDLKAILKCGGSNLIDVSEN